MSSLLDTRLLLREWLHGPYRKRGLSRPVWRGPATPDAPLFTHSESTLRLEVAARARVEVGSAFGWKLVWDGRLTSERLDARRELVLPALQPARVSWQGHSGYVIWEEAELPRSPGPVIRVNWREGAWSFAAHGALGVMALLALQKSASLISIPVIVSHTTTPVTAPTNAFEKGTAFLGRGLWEQTSAPTHAPSAHSPLESLAALAHRLSSSTKALPALQAPAPKATAPAIGLSGGSLAHVAQAAARALPTKITIPTNTKSEGTRPEDEARLRKAFAALEPALARVFDEALKSDPGLSLLVRFEVTVGSDGSLGDVRLQSSGTGLGEARTRLEQGFTQALQSVRVAGIRSGTRVRGENSFRR